jgi:hypothetical protein
LLGSSFGCIGTEDTEANIPATRDPAISLDGCIKFTKLHQRRALQIQCATRQYVAYVRLHDQANAKIEKILEPAQSKLFDRPVYYYYHTILQTARWDKPKFLGSLDLVKVAPTYAVEQAAIILQGAWRRRTVAWTEWPHHHHSAFLDPWSHPP